jgi:CubicO group peptidase (beta-lactamase class C family)
VTRRWGRDPFRTGLVQAVEGAARQAMATSLSKPVTAWGVLRLVESGRIGLDEPVPGYLRR